MASCRLPIEAWKAGSMEQRDAALENARAVLESITLDAEYQILGKHTNEPHLWRRGRFAKNQDALTDKDQDVGSRPRRPLKFPEYNFQENGTHRTGGACDACS